MDDFVENTAVTKREDLVVPDQTDGGSPWGRRLLLGFLLILTGGLIAAIGAGVIMNQHTGRDHGTALLERLLKNRISPPEVERIITGGIQAGVLIQPFPGVDFTIKTERLQRGDRYNTFLNAFAGYLYRNNGSGVAIKITDGKIQRILKEQQGAMEWYRSGRNIYFFFGTILLGVILLGVLFFTWRMIPRWRQPYLLGLTAIIGMLPLIFWLFYPRLLWGLVIPDQWFSAGEIRDIFIDDIVALGIGYPIFEMVTVLTALLLLLIIGGWITRFFKNNTPGWPGAILLWVFLLGIAGHFFYSWFTRDTRQEHLVKRSEKMQPVNQKKTIPSTEIKEAQKEPLLQVISGGKGVAKLEVNYYHPVEPGLGLMIKVNTFYTDSKGWLQGALPDQKNGLLCATQISKIGENSTLYGCVTTLNGKPLSKKLTLTAERTVMGQWPQAVLKEDADPITRLKVRSNTLAGERGFMVREVPRGAERESGGEIAAGMMMARFWDSDTGKKVVAQSKKRVIEEINLLAQKRYAGLEKGYQWERSRDINLLIDRVRDGVREQLYQSVKQYLNEQISGNKLVVDQQLGVVWRNFILQQIELSSLITAVLKERSKDLTSQSEVLFKKIDEVTNKYPGVTRKQVIESILEQKAIIAIPPVKPEVKPEPAIKTTLYPDGTTRCRWEENGPGEKEGVEQCYYPDGKLKSKIQFQKGVLHGTAIYYGKDGSELDKRFFEMGRSISKPAHTIENEPKKEEKTPEKTIEKEREIEPDELLEGD